MARPSKETLELEMVEDDQSDNWFLFIDKDKDVRASLRLIDEQWFVIRDWNENKTSLAKSVQVMSFWKGLELIKNHHNATLEARERVYKRFYTVWGHRKKSVLKEI